MFRKQRKPSELFKISLILDRQQKKLLDSIENKCFSGVYSLIQEAVRQTHELNTLVHLSVFESMVNDPQFCSQDLNEETKKYIASLACDKYARIISGEIDSRAGRYKKMACRFSSSDVIFAITEKIVKIPHLGICKFSYNNKVMLMINNMLITKNGDYYTLGYVNNQPTLVVVVKNRS